MIDPAEVIARYQDEAPVDVDRIAAALKIPVRYAQLPDDIAGKIERVRREPPRFQITINARHHPNRQRFTLAHEIAHYILHRDLIAIGVTDSVMYRSNMSDHIEVQANRKAAQIIMPALLVREEWAEIGSLQQMAEEFGVSPEAMRIRLETLGLRR